MLIYCFRNKITQECLYVGSTKNSLCWRKKRHKEDAKKIPERCLYKTITELGGWDAIDIVVLEENLQCSKEELLWKEREYIQNLKPSCNMFCPIRTKEESRELNRQKAKNYRNNYKPYYEKNKEKILENQRKRYAQKKAEKNILSPNIEDDRQTIVGRDEKRT